MSDKKALLQAIAKQEALLSRLDSEREQALSRLAQFPSHLRRRPMGINSFY
jgi:hypothetical protein